MKRLTNIQLIIATIFILFNSSSALSNETDSGNSTTNQLILDTGRRPMQTSPEQEAYQYANSLNAINESIKKEKESFFSRGTLSSIHNTISNEIKNIIKNLEIQRKYIIDSIYQDSKKIELHPEKLDPVIRSIDTERDRLHELINSTPTETQDPANPLQQQKNDATFNVNAN